MLRECLASLQVRSIGESARFGPNYIGSDHTWSRCALFLSDSFARDCTHYHVVDMSRESDSVPCPHAYAQDAIPGLAPTRFRSMVGSQAALSLSCAMDSRSVIPKVSLWSAHVKSPCWFLHRKRTLVPEKSARRVIPPLPLPPRDQRFGGAASPKWGF